MARQHHVQVNGRPSAVVAVGDGQPGNRGRECVPLGSPTRRRFRRDLADAVGTQERPHAVVVSERSILSEDPVPLGLVDGGGRTMQKGASALMVLHEIRQAAAVGRQVQLPVVGLRHREVEDVVRVLRQPPDVARDEVDRHALDAGVLQLRPGCRVGEARRPDDPVATGQRSRQRARHLTGHAGDHDGAVMEFPVFHGSFRTRYAARVHLFAAFLGGDLSAGRMGEDHEIVFVVAEDMPSARRAAKAKWGGGGRPHVDALDPDRHDRRLRRRARAGGGRRRHRDAGLQRGTLRRRVRARHRG